MQKAHSLTQRQDLMCITQWITHTDEPVTDSISALFTDLIGLSRETFRATQRESRLRRGCSNVVGENLYCNTISSIVCCKLTRNVLVYICVYQLNKPVITSRIGRITLTMILPIAYTYCTRQYVRNRSDCRFRLNVLIKGGWRSRSRFDGHLALAKFLRSLWHQPIRTFSNVDKAFINLGAKVQHLLFHVIVIQLVPYLILVRYMCPSCSVSVSVTDTKSIKQ